MRNRIAYNSRREGRAHSRLPTLSSYWIKEIKGTVDYFSLNYYTSRLINELTDETQRMQGIEEPSWEHDLHVSEAGSVRWKHSQLAWLWSAPEGMGDILR